MKASGRDEDRVDLDCRDKGLGEAATVLQSGWMAENLGKSFQSTQEVHSAHDQRQSGSLDSTSKFKKSAHLHAPKIIEPSARRQLKVIERTYLACLTLIPKRVLHYNRPTEVIETQSPIRVSRVAQGLRDLGPNWPQHCRTMPPWQRLVGGGARHYSLTTQSRSRIGVASSGSRDGADADRELVL